MREIDDEDFIMSANAALAQAEDQDVVAQGECEIISRGYVKRLRWNTATLALTDIATGHQWSYDYELDAEEMEIVSRDPTFELMRMHFEPDANYDEGAPLPQYIVGWCGMVTREDA